MDNKFPKYCMVNYQSARGIDNKPSYDFWFTSSLIRVIGDQPFGRGDIARINEIRKPSNTEWNIDVDILGDPSIDKDAKLFYDTNPEEIPTLIFATSKIYLNKTSEMHIYSTENVEVILNCSSMMNDNKSCTVAALISGKQGRIYGIDKVNGTPIEWLITDSPGV